MAFFRGGGFDDPFFGDMNRMMRSHMRDLDALLDPFGFIGGSPLDNGRYRSPRQQMIDDDGASGSNGGHNRRHESRSSALVQRDPMASLIEPFGFGFGGGLFGGLMRQMEQLQQQSINDPDAHVYTQSTVISMRPGQDGRPQYYEATDSVRKAGDVKETRRSVRDSGRGLEKMEIGHHIGGRGHVIEKRRDRTTGGQIVENQEFVGLNQDEAQQFDQEWTRVTRRALSGERYLVDDDSTAGPQLAIEGSRSHHRNRVGSPYAQSRTISGQTRRPPVFRQKKRKSSVRVEEPEEHEPTSSNSKATKGGPQIIELE